jgi:hypothetical protein
MVRDKGSNNYRFGNPTFNSQPKAYLVQLAGCPWLTVKRIAESLASRNKPMWEHEPLWLKQRRAGLSRRRRNAWRANHPAG